MTCIEFFGENSGKRDIYSSLQELDNAKLFQWENETASLQSPGPVQNEEILIRQIISPHHFDAETKKLKTSAFTDSETFGLSVNRLSHTTVELIHDVALERIEKANINAKNPKAFWGTVNFFCAEVRAIFYRSEEGVAPLRGFVIYDTADPEDPSHADIFTAVPDKAKVRSVRLSLQEIANNFLEHQPH